jgi:plastocyanin
MRPRPRLGIVLAVAACGATTALAGSASSATTRSIKIGDNYFVRSSGVPTVTVKANTRVTWHWTGESAHDVRVSRGPVKFNSKVQTTGTYSKLVTRRGTYRIYCEIHGAKDQSMVLRVQ